MSTTRPLAREMTGTSREMSGKIVPVAVNSLADSICVATVSGNFATSLASMVTRFMSATGMTLVGGGAPSPSLLPLQPERARLHDTARTKASETLCARLREEDKFIG